MTEQVTIPIPPGRKCAAEHFGPWAVEPKWFKSAVDAVRAGTLKPKADYDDEEDGDSDPGYKIVSGVAVICIDGHMTKRGGSFSGCSTVEVRRAVRAAAADWMVDAILLHICSPGGTVSGTADLAADVKAARDKKPVHAYIADMGCSAAYWVASQCETIRANVTAVVGSIGTYTVLEDDTKLTQEIGIRFTVVSTGEYKGLGADGAVTDKLVADVQREVNELNAPFLAAVAEGRKGKIADVPAIADGRAHVGEQAKQLGLIDSIASLDAAIEAVSKRSLPMTPTEQVNKIAAEHPESVASFREEGKKAGKAEAHREETDRMKAISAVCPARPELAIKSFIAGHTADHVATIVTELDTEAAKRQTEDETHKKALAEKQAEIDRLKFALDDDKGVRTAGGKKEEPKGAVAADIEKIEDPKERAKAEWAADTNGCKAEFVSEAAYVGYRAAALRGGVTIHKPGNAA